MRLDRLGEWETLETEKAGAVLRALSHPKRRAIYDALSSGPVRQYKLAKELFPQPKQSGFEPRHLKYSESLLRHHLKPLEQAGLIDSIIEGNEKYVRRVLDVRVQARRRPEEKPLVREPARTREEAAERLKGIFVKRRR